MQTQPGREQHTGVGRFFTAGARGFLALILFLPLAAISVIALMNPPLPSTACYCAGAIVLAASVIASPARRGRRRVLCGTGLALLALTLGVRAITVSDGPTIGYGLEDLAVRPPARDTITDTADPRTAPLLARLIAERDLALSGARLLVWGRRFTPVEAAGLVEQLRSAYGEMLAQEGEVASPALLNLWPAESAVQTQIIQPSHSPINGAVIFLHGFGGNFTLPCWLFSRAPQELGLVTLCPTLGWRGDWWSSRGRRIVRRTIADLRQRGVQRIFLAGLSNGGAGTGVLLGQLSRQLSGAILISGCPRRATPHHRPVLVLQGRQDTMAPAATCRRYAARAGPTVRYVELPGDHFLLLKQHAQVTRHLRRWLARRLGQRPAPGARR